MKKLNGLFLFALLRRKNRSVEYRSTFIQGEWYILPEQEFDLDRLAMFMKYNPGMKVELNLHQNYTGNQSEDEQSLQLRAKVAIDYLVSEGIQKSRLISNRFRFSSLPCFRLMSA